MSDDRLGRWPVRIEIPVAWGDMDALGHVNNTVYLRWYESSRLVYFERTGLTESMAARAHGPIMARQSIDYRLPVTYPDRVAAETTVTRLGNTSFVMAFRIWGEASGAVVAEGEGVMVMVDYTTGAKVPLDQELAQAIYALEARG